MKIQYLKGIREINIRRWENLLKNSSFASPFQSADYFNLMNTLQGTEAYVFAIESESELQALCVVTIQKEKGPKAYFSRRGIIYGGPVIRDDSDVNIPDLLDYIETEIKSKVIYLEVRNFFDYSIYNGSFEKSGWEYIPYLNVQVKLNGENFDSLLSDMKSNRRREIRYSLKEGAQTRIIENESDLKTLYQILHELYQNVVRLPLPDYDYFLNLYRSSVGKIFGVYHNEMLIGGAVCLFYPGKSVYTHYYCGLRDYHKKIFPTHLAIKAAMEFGIENNLESIDLMGAGKPDEEYGVRSYKKQFGGNVVEHGRFLKILNPFLYKTGKTGLELIKKLKVPI